MKDRIIDSIGRIDNELIESVDALRTKKRPPAWIRYGALAACLCLAVVTAFALKGGIRPEQPESETEASHETEQRQEAPRPMDDEPSIEAIPMVFVNDTLYVARYDDSVTRKEDGLVLLGTIQKNILDGADASTDTVPKENFHTNQQLVGCEVYQDGEDIAVLVEGMGYLHFVPYGGPDTDRWNEAMTGAGGTLIDTATDDIFGRLFPTRLADGYEPDENGAAIYGDSVLQARLIVPELDDELLIRVAANDYFGVSEYGSVLYGDPKSDGTRSSMIYYENDGFTILYQFDKTDIGDMDDEAAERFFAMIRSARCFDKDVTTCPGDEGADELGA